MNGVHGELDLSLSLRCSFLAFAVAEEDQRARSTTDLVGFFKAHSTGWLLLLPPAVDTNDYSCPPRSLPGSSSPYSCLNTPERPCVGTREVEGGGIAMAPEVSGCPDPNPIKQISCCGGLWGNPGQEFANAICAGGRTDGPLGTREEKLRAPALARSTIAFLQIGALNGMHKPGRRGEREREREREKERERERETRILEKVRTGIRSAAAASALLWLFHLRAIPHKVFRE